MSRKGSSRLIALLTCVLALAAIDGRAAPVNDWLGFTAEVRTRYEGRFDFDFDESKNDDDNFVLLRTRIGLDVKPHDLVRFFAEIQDSRTFGEEESTASNEKGIDLHQGYGEIVKPIGLPVSLRVGRQEVAYGQHRLIGNFGWDNVGRSFDGLKVMVKPTEALGVDLFWAQVSEAKGAVDDDSQVAWLYGSYAKKSEAAKLVLEPYVIYRGDNAGKEKYPGDKHLSEFSLGGRGEWGRGGFSLDGEIVTQLGDFGNQDIHATAVHAGAGYTLGVWAKPMIAFEYNFSTGDKDPEDSKHQTLDNLFPTNHPHYGFMDLVAWKNIHDYRATVGLAPIAGLKASAEFHVFALDEAADALYRASGAVLRAGAPGRSKDVGEEVDLLVNYAVNEYLSLLGGYSHFFAGKFFVESGPNDDADFAYVQVLFGIK